MLFINEHEKQVYHEFEPINNELEKQHPNIIPLGFRSRFDVHRLVLDGPKGMDPCQNFEQQCYGIKKFAEIEKIANKQLKIQEIRQGSESEGVQREQGCIIPIPKPQSYHNYC